MKSDVVMLFAIFLQNQGAEVDAALLQVIDSITNRIRTREITGKNLDAIKQGVRGVQKSLTRRKSSESLAFPMQRLAAVLGDSDAIRAMSKTLLDTESAESKRLAAASVLVGSNVESVSGICDRVFANPQDNTADFRGKLLTELGRLKDDKVADVVLKHYKKLEPELQPKAIELLTQRANWSRKLLAAIGKKQVPANAINLNQARRLMGFKDKQLREMVRKHWGIVRTTRDPKRAEYVAKWKRFIRSNPGDPFKGEKVFKKVCAQCHKMYGKGVEVGPDITRNGRNSFDQLLSNVFDPSLVIGASYRAYQVATKDGRVITGLLVENSPERIVLKVQGGKKETIPRGEIELAKESKVSMMPEQLEKQLKPQEIADLFAFITLDRHPSDPKATQLPGVRADRRKKRRRR